MTHRNPMSLTRYCHLAGFIVAFFAIAICAQAAEGGSPSAETATEHVQARLVASMDNVYPGAEILLGVNQRIIPHWHTYWQNSGDSGIPTTIDWKLPQGASAGDILWPIPKRFHIGPVTNYGYEHEVTLLSPLKIPADAVVGSTFPIRATVNWLVCQEICVPEQVELSLSLPVVAKPDASSSGNGQPQAQNSLIKKALATLPAASPWPVSVAYAQDAMQLRITGSALQSDTIRDVYFYPVEWGKVLHHADQKKKLEDNAVVLALTPGEAPPKADEALNGVLVVTEEQGGAEVSRGFTVKALPVPLAKGANADAVAPIAAGSASSAFTPENVTAENVTPENADSINQESSLGLPAALLLALLGGVILNLMPCVFPVLSIKALSLLSHAHQGRAVVRLHGVAYTLGILLSFALLGGILIALKAGGAQIGWGFQFQSPTFVLVVAYLMFAVGLSLSGVFAIGGSVAGVGSSLAERPGYSGSFFTGVLATVVATPCTAPFMGAALGYALAQPGWVLLSVFLSLGLGLALPYLLLSTWPLLQRWLPRPGIWMERLKQGLAFPMYLAAVWLVWVLAQQAGANAIAIALAGMVVLAFAGWLYGSTRSASGLARKSGTALAALAVVAALAGGYAGIQGNQSTTVASASESKLIVSKPTANKQNWEPYTAERLQVLLAEGKPVFLNLTAAWCITCLANERVALSDSRVVEAFKNSGITYLKGDWTNQDSQITNILKEFGRSGVPLYVVYAAGRPNQLAAQDSTAAVKPAIKPQVLPQILTPDIVLNAVQQTVNPS